MWIRLKSTHNKPMADSLFRIFFLSHSLSLSASHFFKGGEVEALKGVLFVCVFVFLFVHTDQARPQANNAKQGREGKDTFWAIKKTGSWAKPKATHEVLI